MDLLMKFTYCRMTSALMNACSAKHRNKSHNHFSLSMPSISAARDNATTSMSENLGTGPRCGTFPDSLTRFSEKSLCISSILTNFV